MLSWPQGIGIVLPMKARKGFAFSVSQGGSGGFEIVATSPDVERPKAVSDFGDPPPCDADNAQQPTGNGRSGAAGDARGGEKRRGDRRAPHVFRRHVRPQGGAHGARGRA